MTGKRTPEKIRVLRRMAREGATSREIGAVLDVSHVTAWQWAKYAGIALRTVGAPGDAVSSFRKSAAALAHYSKPEALARKREAARRTWSDPGIRARRLAAVRASNRARSMRARVAIPPWVPADLIEDFTDIAVIAGEEAAASHVRRLKRQAAA